MEKEKIVLPADVYDAIEFAALAFRGIGAGMYALGPHGQHYYGDELEVVAPVCAVGFGAFIGLDGIDSESGVRAEYVLGINSVDRNDRAVNRINKRKGRSENRRVSFAEWREELGVVRGDSDA